VEEQPKTEEQQEQQKDIIFNIFSKCRKEIADRRLIYYSELCHQIYIWYKDYLYANVDKIGLEIAEVISRFNKDEIILKIPEDKDGFFSYLYVSIKNEKKSSNRKYVENETVKISSGEKRKLRKVEDFIRMTESHLEKGLTNDELIQGMSGLLKEQKYADLMNLLNIDSTSYTSNDGDEMDALNSTVTPIYNANSIDDPLDVYIINTDMEILREAVKYSLEEIKDEKIRNCNRALFTLHCIDNGIEKCKDFDKLYPLLDSEMMEIWQKDRKKPKAYEIYQKYHPNASKGTAGGKASDNLRVFRNKIKEYCEHKGV
jgi:hypothetical protein